MVDLPEAPKGEDFNPRIRVGCDFDNYKPQHNRDISIHASA